jgi:hypothetical protein
MRYTSISKIFCIGLMLLFILMTFINFAKTQGQTISYQTSNIQEQRLLLVTTIRNNFSNTQELKKLLKSFLDEDPNNLELLLDTVLPESITVQQIQPNAISDLIEQLSSDNYPEVKKAILELYLLGPIAESQVKKKYENCENPLEGIFLQGIISRWEMAKLKDPERSQIQNILSEYIKGITDVTRILSLQKRALQFLNAIKPNSNQWSILDAIFRVSAKTGDDKVVNQLAPLLDHPDTSIAVHVVREVGFGRDNRFFPNLLLVALQSNKEQIVDEAIKKTPNCWDGSKSKAVRESLEKIFNGENESLKFNACFPLMHGYGDQKAIAYLLSQTISDNKVRAVRAISWIGDACNAYKKEYSELLECLVPLLKSEDNEIRRAASDALGTYSGENVIRNLIRMLTDKEKIISVEALNNLFGQKDKDLVLRLLAEALEKTTDEALISKIHELQNAISTQTRTWNR